MPRHQPPANGCAKVPDLNVVFLGSGRCFHTFDWFWSCELLLGRRVPFITDNFEGDGLPCLFREGDDVRRLLIIDRILSPRASSLGHKWRNLVKLLLIPVQILLLRRHLAKLGNPFVVAHSTYYAFLASFTNAAYSATPQGSEVLVRPDSPFYRWLLKRSVKKASFVTVDSEAMRGVLRALTDRPVHIVQNGIDVRAVRAAGAGVRDAIVSIRAIAANYRILEILKARDEGLPDTPLSLIFPFTEAGYLAEVENAVGPHDLMLGRLERSDLYRLVARSICILSIPVSDSSPRSVYEAIFAGAAAICAPSQYIDALPACMRARVIVVNVGQPGWFAEAFAQASEIVKTEYRPSEEALLAFDQVESMARTLNFAAEFANPHCAASAAPTSSMA